VFGVVGCICDSLVGMSGYICRAEPNGPRAEKKLHFAESGVLEVLLGLGEQVVDLPARVPQFHSQGVGFAPSLTRRQRWRTSGDILASATSIASWSSSWVRSVRGVVPMRRASSSGESDNGNDRFSLLCSQVLCRKRRATRRCFSATKTCAAKKEPLLRTRGDGPTNG